MDYDGLRRRAIGLECAHATTRRAPNVIQLDDNDSDCSIDCYLRYATHAHDDDDDDDDDG